MLSIVLPVHNEEKNIPLIGKKYQKLSKKFAHELIFVEDSGSSDGTRTQIEKLATIDPRIRFIFTKQKGYGYSIRNGLKKAQGEYVCWTHADLQTDLGDALRAYEIMIASAEPKKTFIKGQRYGRPAFDTFFTVGMSVLETVTLKTLMHDINAQPNLFHQSFLKHLNNAPGDFSFDLFAYYQAKKLGYTMKRFPVNFAKRIHGHSHWNTSWKEKWKFIKRTLEFTNRLKKTIES